VALDQAIRDAETAGVGFAPLFSTFDSDAALCTLTLLCSDGDAYPSDAGYAAIADTTPELARSARIARCCPSRPRPAHARHVNHRYHNEADATATCILGRLLLLALRTGQSPARSWSRRSRAD
jgi:hypothetical protein